MANISHKNLTSTQIHEPKGADTADANRVYVSNGSGSGAWSQVPAAALTTLANPLYNSLLLITYELSANTAEATYASGAHRTLNLNTVKLNNISGSSLSNNQVSLPAGTYLFFVSTVAGQWTERARLYNVTDASIIANGIRTEGWVTGSIIGFGFYYPNTFFGTFTLGSTKTVELQQYFSNSQGFHAMNQGGNETYRYIAFWKVA